MTQQHLSVVILAAGQGTRMKSKLPKVLHPIGGKPLLTHVIHTSRDLNAIQTVVVYGHGGEQVKTMLAMENVVWVEQKKQLGTGHAVDQARSHLNDDHIILVLYGDVPLINANTLADLVKMASNECLAILTVHLDNPHGYGRIVRDALGHIQRIVEQKDASAQELAIAEVNTGILAVSGKRLKSWLQRLDNSNAQGEYYLTDVIAMAVTDGVSVQAAHPASEDEVLGVNSRSQLAYLERVYQRQQAEALMVQGVTVVDPARLDVRGSVQVGKDVTLDVNVVLEGNVVIEDDVYIGPNCLIRDSYIGKGATIGAGSVIVKEAPAGKLTVARGRQMTLDHWQRPQKKK